MRAALIEHYGGPERLEVHEVHRPKPDQDRLLIRVRATSINQIDWRIRSGSLRLLLPARFPVILGFDVAGTIEEVGQRVEGWDVGQEVYGVLDHPHGHAYAEFATASPRVIAPKPPELSFEEAAALPLCGITALQALRDRGGLEEGKGQRVLINGAAGGVGHLAVQIAKTFGATVTGTASPEHHDLLGQLGCDHMVDYHQKDVAQGEDKFDIILDAVGKRSFGECKAILAHDGTYISTVPEPRSLGWTIATHAAGIVGYDKHATTMLAQPKREDLAFLSQLVAQGKLRPVIEWVYTLEEVAQAHRDVEAGHTAGKRVVRID